MKQNENKYDSVYVAFSISPTQNLLECQDYVCSIQQLIPRLEFHITFGFFGKIPPVQVKSLGRLMRPFIDKEFKFVNIEGIGGAYENVLKQVQFITSLDTSFLVYPRVFWLSVNCSNAMLDFRNSLISTVISLGIPSNFLRPFFWPHITLGSNGPEDLNVDWSLWDVHTIEKKPTLEKAKYPEKLRVETIHITSVSVHPKGLFKIW
jgi:2'-5' RNA ligase